MTAVATRPQNQSVTDAVPLTQKYHQDKIDRALKLMTMQLKISREQLDKTRKWVRLTAGNFGTQKQQAAIETGRHELAFASDAMAKKVAEMDFEMEQALKAVEASVTAERAHTFDILQGHWETYAARAQSAERYYQRCFRASNTLQGMMH